MSFLYYLSFFVFQTNFLLLSKPVPSSVNSHRTDLNLAPFEPPCHGESSDANFFSHITKIRGLLEVRLSKINKKKSDTHRNKKKKTKTPVTRSIRIVRPSFQHHSTRLRTPRPTVPESPAQSATFSSRRLLEVRDDGVAVRLLLEARKDHLGVGNVLLGVLKVPMQFFVNLI
jgi:hypothetical protein